MTTKTPLSIRQMQLICIMNFTAAVFLMMLQSAIAICCAILEMWVAMTVCLLFSIGQLFCVFYGGRAAFQMTNNMMALQPSTSGENTEIRCGNFYSRN